MIVANGCNVERKKAHIEVLKVLVALPDLSKQRILILYIK